MKVIGIVIIIVFFGIELMQLKMYLDSQKIKGLSIPDDVEKLLGRGDTTHSQRSLVYFYSPSCGPCRSMTPVIDKLISEGKPAAKVDINGSPEVASRLGIRATPTTLVINNQIIEKVILGAQSEQKLLQLLKGV
ncbi:MAG: hypothetical protein DSZ33_00695 [Gammaproteobacteria bacterium]|nr:MAG: hypothetical protein DSZ33_00695 [Gammaproteobacteria bacterium]